MRSTARSSRSCRSIHASRCRIWPSGSASASPCARRIRILEEAGVITGYAAIIDQTKVGLPISVFVSIKLERQREDELDRFSQAVARWPEVVDCYLMTGQRDYLLRIVVRDLPAYERFLKDKLTRLDGVASIESSFALGQVKRSSALPIAAVPEED